jgi:hypothetical protein
MPAALLRVPNGSKIRKNSIGQRFVPFDSAVLSTTNLGLLRLAVDRTIRLGKLVQLRVKPFDLEPVRQLWCALPTGDLDEGVVHQLLRDLLPAQPGGQPVGAVEVDL